MTTSWLYYLAAAAIPGFAISIPNGLAWPLLFFYPFALEKTLQDLKQKKHRLILFALMGMIGFYWIYYWAHSPFGGLGIFPAFALTLIAAPLCVYPFFILIFIPNPRLATAIVPWLFFLPLIFPWSLGGMSGFPFDQWATVVGTPGLNFLIFIPWILSKMNKPVAVISLVILVVGGVFLGSCFLPKASDSNVRFRLVQPSIENESKLAAERGEKLSINGVLEKLETTSLQENHIPDLTVWPETSYPYIYENGRGSHDEKLKNILTKIKTPLLFGSYKPPTRQGTDGSAGALLVSPTGEEIFYQSKHQLLIFGEYLPKYLSFIREIAPTIAEFEQGPVPEIRQTGFGPLLISICYEGIHPWLFHKISAGSFHINLTNDSWYGPSTERWQHLNLNRMRAIEHRTYLLRATNDGISAVYGPSGKMIAKLDRGQRDHLDVELPRPGDQQTQTPWSTSYAYFNALIAIYMLFMLWQQRHIFSKRY